jgi:hypothetical protein
MQSTLIKAFPVFLALMLAGASPAARADDGCLDFKWDVSKERALFAGVPAVVKGGKDPASATIVIPDRLYTLRLASQDQVAFSVPPAKKPSASPSYAGLATLKIAAPGSYRVSVDLPIWIDMVSQGTLVAAKDYQGQHACNAPHKIVEFELQGAQPFLLQLSNAAADSITLTVTASPARKF